MKALIVICVIVLLLQLAALGVSISVGDGGAPPNEAAIKKGNEPKAEDFPLMARFDALLDRFRPRIELPWQEKSFQPGAEGVPFKHGAEQRLAKFELTAGSGALIKYDCGALSHDCPQTVCLCAAGAPLLAPEFTDCKSDGGVCAKDGNRGAITVYDTTGTLVFSGLGPAGGTVRQR